MSSSIPCSDGGSDTSRSADDGPQPPFALPLPVHGGEDRGLNEGEEVRGEPVEADGLLQRKTKAISSQKRTKSDPNHSHSAQSSPLE